MTHFALRPYLFLTALSTLSAAAAEQAPLIAKAFNDAPVNIQLNGKRAVTGDDYRAGWCQHLDRTDLILWIDRKTNDSLHIVIESTAS